MPARTPSERPGSRPERTGPAGARSTGARSTGTKPKRRNPNRWRFYVLLAILGLILAVVLWFTVGRQAWADLQADEPSPEETGDPVDDDDAASDEDDAEPDLANPVPCLSDAVDAELSLDTTSLSAGDSLRITMDVTNTGDVPCLVNLGHGALTVQVTSGDDVIWDTAECPRGDEEVSLLLDIDASSDRTITWDGQRCGTDDDARPGSYQVTAELALDGGELDDNQSLEVTGSGNSGDEEEED